MFCHKCGMQLPEGTVFCAGCGAPQEEAQRTELQQGQEYFPKVEVTGSYEQQYRPQEPYGQQAGQQYAYPYQQYAPQGQQYPPQADMYASGAVSGGAAAGAKSGLLLKIAIPVAAVVILALAAFYFVGLRSPVSLAGRAVINMSEEILQRFDGTPFKAAKILSDTLKDGKVTVNFDYENTRYGEEVSGSVTLFSVMDDNEFALAGNIMRYDGYWNEEIDFEFEAFLNKERVAVGSKQFNNNYYGFRFNTFRDDIRGFGDLVGLDRKTMSDMADIVEIFGEALNTNSKNSAVDEKYLKLLTDFYNSCEQTSERVDMEVDGKTTKVTKLDIVVSKDAIMGLLDGIYEVLAEDEDVRALYTQFSQYSYGPSYNNMLRDYRNALTYFERSYSESSVITVTLFIGNKDRLMRLDLDANLRIDSERVRFSGTLDFGASATDRWTLKIDSGRESIRINWDYRERSNRIENTITVDTGYDKFTLTSDWSPSRGDFILSAEDEYGYGMEITGEFVERARGFTLKFDDFMESYYSESLTIEIIAESIANIKRIDFINIDKWDEDFLYDLEDFFYDIGF